MTRRADLLSPEQMTMRLIRHAELLGEFRRLYAEACSAGASPASSWIDGGRGTGFSDHDPTFAAVFSPTRRRLRSRARGAATIAFEAMEQMERACAELDDAFLLTDDEVLARFLEKRRAALA